MKTPKSQTYNTGDQGEGYNQIKKFFDSIIKEDLNLPKNHPHIEIKVMGMYLLDKYRNKARTNENTHMLLYQQRVIATVIETRTDSNYVNFDFFQNLETITQNP